MDSSERNNHVYLPEGREFNLIEELVSLLNLFVKATTLMSGSKYSTIGIVCPLLYKLLENTLAVQTDDSPTLKNVKIAIHDDLRLR
jgi:hypothetical protein